MTPTTSSPRYILLSTLLALFVSCAQAQPPQSSGFGKREDRGLLDNPLINEASGLAASRRNPGVLWTHNDSGDTTRIFAMTTRGRDLGEFYLAGTSARDWEDMAVGPGPEKGINYIYVGDIGDNNAVYETKRIYRVPEPEVDTTLAATNHVLDGVETITYRYPDGPRDAEALMVDPQTRDIYIVSKREDSVRVYCAPWPQSTTETITLEYRVTLPGITLIDGGDISVDGNEILLRNYVTVFYWRRLPGKPLWEAFKGDTLTLPYTPEPQGEAIAWAVDGSGYYTTSEEPREIPAHLYFYPRLEVSSVKEGMGENRRSTDGPQLSVALRFSGDNPVSALCCRP